MTINVKLFATVRELAGVSELALDLADAATVAAAREALAARYPASRDALARAAFAVNRTYAPATAALSDGDELAVIPPVSGG
jgi:molybdopterin synthase catalytic subunit